MKVNKNFKDKHRGENGFTLFELCISIMILGIMLSGSILGVGQFVQGQNVKVTRERIDQIQNALSAYVQTHYRLPCPADPGAPAAQQGMESNNGRCFNTLTNTADLYWQAEGVVPWKELGLQQGMVVDAGTVILHISLRPI